MVKAMCLAQVSGKAWSFSPGVTCVPFASQHRKTDVTLAGQQSPCSEHWLVDGGSSLL